MSKNWTYSSKLFFFKKLRQFFLSGKLCEDHGYTYHWKSGQKPHLTKNGKRIDCNFSNYVPFAVPALSTSSSTTHTENPVPERSGRTSEEQRRNPMHKPTETENKNKDERREEVPSDLLHELPHWLQEFRENFVD